MGMTIKVNSIEDMCSLMCDNTIPKQKYKYCLRCGKPLKSDESKRVGYGPLCYSKMLHESKLSLF